MTRAEPIWLDRGQKRKEKAKKKRKNEAVSGLLNHTWHLEEDEMNKRRVGGHMTQVETGVIGQRWFEFQRPKMRVNELGFDPRFRSVRHFTDCQQLQIVVTLADPRHLPETSFN